MTITPEEGRVLGCLVEKQFTTPQQYPLTANALALACSQATNRHPVLVMDDEATLHALDGLKAQRLVRFVLPSHGRSVTRYRHVLDECYALDVPALALMAVLLLRGPQTPGELRARTERMTPLSSVGEVQTELEALAANPEGLVRLLPRRPGQKEDRWQQLLADQWADEADPPAPAPSMVGPEPEPTERPEPESADRSDLRHDVETLKTEVAHLHSALDALTTAFETLRRSLGE